MNTATAPGFSRYIIHSNGQIVSLCHKVPRSLATAIDRDGYHKLVMYDDAFKCKSVRRAAVVCAAFHGPKPDGMTVRHLDGSKDNDDASNLCWGTVKENMEDKRRHGTLQTGESHSSSVLTADAARHIRNNPNANKRELAKRFGVSVTAIFDVLARRTWKSVV